MKAVIDTNILVSGILWNGPPHRILQAWKVDKFEWILSTEILEEYRRVHAELIARYKPFEQARMLDLLSVKCTMVRAALFDRVICTDPDDDKFLGAALSANADYIVTVDKALLKVRIIGYTKIITASQFVKLLR